VTRVDNIVAQELRKTHDSLRMIDAIPTLAWCSLPDGSVESLNQRWLDYTGVSPEDAHGWGWKQTIHPDDLDKVEGKWREIVASREPGELEVRVRRFDSEYRWFLLRAEPFRESSGNIVRWYGTCTDIEDRKRAESLLSAENRTLEMISQGASLREILENLCEIIETQSRGVTCTVLLMDSDGRRLWPAAGHRAPKSWTEVISPLEIGLGAGSCGTAAFLKKQVIVADIATDPRWAIYREEALHNGLRASWSQPLLSKDAEVLGTFAMYYKAPRSPSASDLQLIEGAAHVAVIAIQSDRSQTALQQAYQRVKQSEARLRKIIDTIPTLAWCSLPDGSKEFFNQPWHDYTGVSPEAARGWGWQAVIHPGDLAQVMHKYRAMLASGEPGEIEGRFQRFDGEYRWFLSRAHPLRDELGHIVNWYGTDADIENLKRAEEKLREDDRELRLIVDAIAQLVVFLSPDGRALYANKFTLEYTGLSPEDVKAGDFRSRVFHPDDVERLREERQKALSRPAPFQNEQRARQKDGQYRWFAIRYIPLLDERGLPIRWYAAGVDIEDRKQAEERMRNENLALREEIDRSSMFEEIVGSSRPLRRALVQVEKVAPTDSTVLILGETGTGKELFARAIHKQSKRAAQTFVFVNCAAIPSSLIASELFGHEKGAFTGALQRRLGRFELANGGTIFLDEIGDLPPETQISLLRVLQEREIERIGNNRPIAIDVRILTATNRDLESAIAAGTFRQDLFYRLHVFPIEIPSLRERVDDIPLLVEYFIERYAKKAGKKIRRIEKKTLELFQTYDWPGNIRELQNVVERGVILCERETFSVDAAWLKRDSLRAASSGVRLATSLHEHEKQIIEAALAESQGRVSGARGAAAKLGIPRQTLDSRIRSLRINKHEFKVSR
jgi:PAS domain S-box-containing protein